MIASEEENLDKSLGTPTLTVFLIEELQTDFDVDVDVDVVVDVVVLECCCDLLIFVSQAGPGVERAESRVL